MSLFTITHKHVHHFDRAAAEALGEVKTALGAINDKLNHSHLEKQIMAISQAVQANLDAVRQTQNLVKSVGDGLAITNQLLSDQSKQIADLQAQVAAGQTLGPDDLAALAETNADLQDVNTKLAQDIPANTTPPAGGTPPSTTPPADTSGDKQAQPAPAPTDPNAPAPLAGTGPVANPS